MLEPLMGQSIQLTLWLQGLGSWLAPVMQFFTLLSNEEFYFLILPIIMWMIDFQLGFRIGVITLLSVGINDLAKMTFRQPRPYWVDPAAGGFSKPAIGFGLPSGHAQLSLSFFGLLAYEIKKRWATLAAVFIVFMIGLSRIYLGEHFLTDVLAGWLVSGLVLYAFVKLSGPAGRWFSRMEFWARVVVVFGFSLAMILLAALVIAIPADYQVPSEWLSNAAQVYPDATIEPLSLIGSITGGATLFGLSWGYLWIQERGGFKAKSEGGGQRVLRLLIGLVGVVIFWKGLDMVFPDNGDLISWALRYLRYSLVGIWISGLAPLVFIKLGLGRKDS